MKQLVIVVLCLVLAAPAFAGAPAVGLYLSPGVGSDMLSGRFSESWVGPGAHGQIGNTINAESWDGAALGNEWRVWCPSIAAAPLLVADDRDGNGTGNVTWRTSYGGGMFWLSMNGAWGDGTEDYTGMISTFTVETTYQYVMNNIIGIRSNITMSGDFDGYDNCMTYTINNVAFLGDTDQVGPLPADYPVFYDNNCTTGMVTRGGWGIVTDIALNILGDCTVPVEETSWGKIKARYSE